MKASKRAWTAAKLLALCSAVAASCALPGYEIGDTDGSDASQAGSEGVTATGAGGTGGENTTSSGGEGGEGGKNTNDKCPPPNQPPPLGGCSVPSDINCPFRLDCCIVEGKCENGKWNIPPSCPPGCPTFPIGQNCPCQAEEKNHVCADAMACQANSVVEFVKCDGQKWTGFAQAPCCTPDGKCMVPGTTCVHFSFNGGSATACRPNPCAGAPGCSCVNLSETCFDPSLFTCENSDGFNVDCTNPPK